MTRVDDDSILHLVAEGCTDKEIAQRLNMKLRTVNFRLQMLYAKYRIPHGSNRRIKLISVMHKLQ
jgi:DNA-binding NarL/FixJ family response regulator